MRFRKLRIAWSVGWGIVAVLFCVLWVRSYWWVEVRDGPSIGSWTIRRASAPGVFAFGITDAPDRPIRMDADEWWAGETFTFGHPPYRSKLVGYFNYGDDGDIAVPYWFAVMLMTAGSAAPWKSFSLRTLLIATTLIAVVLGLIVWSAR